LQKKQLHIGQLHFSPLDFSVARESVSRQEYFTALSRNVAILEPHRPTLSKNISAFKEVYRAQLS